MRRAAAAITCLAVVAGCAQIRGQEKAAGPGAAQASSGAAPAAAADLTGNWQGTLAVGNGQRILIKVTKDGTQYKGVLYLINGGGRAAAVPAIAVRGADFSFEIPQLSASYDGTLNADSKTISGNVKMPDGSMHELNLAHVSDDAAFATPEPSKSMPADAKPKFDVLTVKPSDPNTPRGPLLTVDGRHIKAFGTSVNMLLTFAYGLHKKQVSDAPEWMDEKFDLDGVPDVEGQPSRPQMRLLIQDALATRFGLKFHHDQRELPVYALTVAKGGPKLTVTSDPPTALKSFFFTKLGQLHVSNSTMRDFCDGMQGAVMDKPMADQTGLTDRYDFLLNWTPDQSQFLQMGGYRPPAQEDPNAPPSLYTALQEQLGLKLEATKAMDDVIVIDHVEKPGAN